MTQKFFRKLVYDSRFFLAIIIALIVGFIPLALKIVPPPFYIAYTLAAIFITSVTRRLAHSWCTHHTDAQKAEHKFLKLRLAISGYGLAIYVGGFGIMGMLAWFFLSTQGADADLDAIVISLIPGLVSKLGCFASIVAIFMSNRVRQWIAGFFSASGLFLIIILLFIGGIPAFLFTILLAASIPGVIATAGLSVWLYTLYLLTRPCHHNDPVFTHKYQLTLTGDQGSTTITPEQTPYALTPSAYNSLSSDTSAQLHSTPYSITCTDDGKKWMLRVANSADLTVLHNNHSVPSECELASGSVIELQCTITTPGTRTKKSRRQVVSLGLFGDIDHTQIFPMESPRDVWSHDYRKICSDGGLVADSPYELTTDYNKSGVMWFITPNNSSEWEVLVDGELITGKARLMIGSFITLRRKGTSEEIASVEVKARLAYETSPGHTSEGSSSTLTFGQLGVGIQEITIQSNPSN